MTDLVKCSRCHSEIESKYFSISRKGVRKKCCNQCLNRNKCDQCNYTCPNKIDLQRHINCVHLKEQNHACSHCDAKFGGNGDLQRHIKTVHLKERNYESTQCDAKFGENGSLQTHIKTVHLKEQNYACPQCDYKCGRNGSLQTHIKICTGDFTGSAGEFKILQLLDDLGLEKDIDFLYDQSYWNVKDKGLLRWDFILNHTSDNPIVIEFDGGFHYRPVRMGNMTDDEALTAFENSQRRDVIKNDYCSNNYIPFLRIPYWDFEKIEQLVMDFISQN